MNEQEESSTEIATQEAPEGGERHEFVADRLGQIRTEMNDKFLEMGMLLLEAFKGGYSKTLGFATFEDFIEEKLKIGYRAGKYMMDIYEVFIQRLNAPVGILCEVGWTKASKLLPVIDSGNMNTWLDFARHHKTHEVEKAVKQARYGEENVQGYSSFSVGVYEDEKAGIKEAIELAARETGNERTGYNLARICQDYASEARARQVQAETVVSEGAAAVIETESDRRPAPHEQPEDEQPEEEQHEDDAGGSEIPEA